jgi:hypothetical protein
MEKDSEAQETIKSMTKTWDDTTSHRRLCIENTIGNNGPTLELTHRCSESVKGMSTAAQRKKSGRYYSDDIAN